VLEVGELRFIAIATPGHAPGHVCFYEKTRGILFGGDLIIQGTIGTCARVLQQPETAAVRTGSDCNTSGATSIHNSCGDLPLGWRLTCVTGRTDLQGADKQAMRASLQSITTLPRDAVLYSGHSPPTTLGEQLQSNYQLIMAVANTQGSPKKEDL
jgi:glyoxylase-like metal-dependent hydrolase (beta-lactamase superfamily II)